MVATTLGGNAARDPNPGRWLGDLGRDLRHAIRGLRRSPGFAASVALMLALGLGANTAMFGIVYGVLLRPLPYPDPAAIVRIGESLGSVGGSDMWLSNRSMPLLEESAESFEQLAGYLEIFGLLSYTVAQRRGEIGIRMALGARRGDILALVARQGAALVAVGAAAGMAGAAASSRVLESLLHGVSSDDLLTFVAAPLVLAAVALVACWLPARRATRVNPIEALRFE